MKGRPALRSTTRRSTRERGQSIVEFALILPLLLILFLAIADLARLYTTMLSVESAAREAADYGAFNSSNWCTDPLLCTDGGGLTNEDKTRAEMETRACVAARNLPDYADADDDPTTGCDNPTITIDLIEPLPGTDCSEPTNATPCRVKVTLGHQFNLIAPVNITMFDVQLGLPSQINFERISIFAISDYGLDTP